MHWKRLFGGLKSRKTIGSIHREYRGKKNDPSVQRRRSVGINKIVGKIDSVYFELILLRDFVTRRWISTSGSGFSRIFAQMCVDNKLLLRTLRSIFQVLFVIRISFDDFIFEPDALRLGGKFWKLMFAAFQINFNTIFSCYISDNKVFLAEFIYFIWECFIYDLIFEHFLSDFSENFNSSLALFDIYISRYRRFFRFFLSIFRLSIFILLIIQFFTKIKREI